MVINIPQYFYKQDIFKTIFIDDITILNYKMYTSFDKICSYNSTNLLIFILKGKKIVSFDNNTLESSVGDVLFVRKGNYIMNQIVDLEENMFESIVICLSDELLLEFSKMYSNVLKKKTNFCYKECSKFQISHSLKNEIETLLFYFLNSNNNDNTYLKEILKLRVFGILLNIINEDISDCLLMQLQDIAFTDKSDFKNIVEDNYDKPISIEELAKLSGRSLTTFKKHFKEIFDDTPKSWITNKRLERAHYLLINSNYNITEICFMLGFENLSHFVKLFKQKYGLSPKQYKKSQLILV